MKVPSLEDMIQQQVVKEQCRTGILQTLRERFTHDYLCQDCQKFLTEHHLALDHIHQEVFIYCYGDIMLDRFRPVLKDGEEGFVIRIVNILNTMLPSKYQVQKSGIKLARYPGDSAMTYHFHFTVI